MSNATPHDSAYKPLFSHLEMLRDLLMGPSSPFHQNAYMKSRLFPPGVVARRCHSYGYVASSRLARLKNPSISLCNHFDEMNY